MAVSMEHHLVVKKVALMAELMEHGMDFEMALK